MKIKMMSAVAIVTASVFLNGCGGGELAKTGFLTGLFQIAERIRF